MGKGALQGLTAVLDLLLSPLPMVYNIINSKRKLLQV